MHLYRWTGEKFEAIPFQIDEVKYWQLHLNNQECAGDSWPSGFSGNCEMNYAFDFATGTPGDGDGVLGDWDELVFLGRDAGASQAPSNVWVAGADALRIDIKVEEVAEQSGQIASTGEGWVSLFKFVTGTNKSYADTYGDWHYVEFDQDLGPDSDGDESCRGIDPVTARMQRACGWAKPKMSDLGGPAIEFRWIGNHTMNGTKIVTAPNAEKADLVDRWKARIGTFGGVEESEKTWDTAGCGRFLGRKDYDPATKAAPIRVIRVAQGTQSGAATTRTDLYYGNLLYTRLRLRVHPGVGPLRMHPDILSARSGATISNSKLDPADTVDGLGIDVDGDGTPNEPGDDDAGDYDASPGVFNWNLLHTTADGDLLWFTRETRKFRFTGDPVYFYNDQGSAVLDEPDSNDGLYGAHGVKWQGETQNMQDMACGNPPSHQTPDPNLEGGLWSEAETIIIAKGSHTVSEYLGWMENPLVTTTIPVWQSYPINPPDPPCPPSLGISQDGDALYAVIDVGTAPCGIEGASLYRSVGLSAFKHLAFVQPGEQYIDAAVRKGVSYRYKAYGYDETGNFSTASAIVSVTIANTNPPEPPVDIVVTPTSQGGEVAWSAPSSPDVVGYDILISDVSGGPYVKLNPVQIPLSAESFVATGLDPSTTYYVVMESIDDGGNTSPQSVETSFTPLP